MKNLLKLLIAVFAISMQAQVTSYDKLRVKELENKPQNSRVIVADENGNLNYKNQSEIQTDLTNYYTKPEANGLLDAKQNKLTAGANVTISGNTISATDTKYNKGTAQDIQTGSNTEGKVWEAKVLADYINSSVWGGQWLSGSMELALVNKNRTVIERIDLSSLATGDLQVTVDDTDPLNPVLVFKQNGTEVGRVPASSLLSGVARDATLNGMTLQFKDLSGTVVYEVSFAGLFNQKADKTTTITGTGGLTGGGTLEENRALSLSAATSANINKGVEAYSYTLNNVSKNGNIAIGDGLEGFPVDANSNANNYINRSIIRLTNGNNGLAFFGDGANNSRRMGIQSGHGSSSYASVLGILELNPFGGPVKINGYTPWHDGNLRSDAQNDALFLQNLGRTDTSGEITISGGTSAILNSVAFSNRQDANEALPTGLRPYGSYSGATGYPFALGAGVVMDAGYGRYFDIWVSNSYVSSPNLRIRQRASETTFTEWEILATREWATPLINAKENAFSKNTAFNKNFGTTAGTVAQGNHSHTFASITAKPTTIAGYGITDGARLNAANTFTAKNTFNQPVVVPMATQPNEAINLSQLTASNPIALNKVVPNKRIDVPVNEGVTIFPIELDENTAVAVVPANLLDVVGSVVEVKVTFKATRNITNGSYKSLVRSTNLGITDLRQIVTGNGSVTSYVDVKVILIRTSSTNVSMSSTIVEVAHRNNVTHSQLIFDSTESKYGHSQYAGLPDFVLIEIFADASDTPYSLYSSPVLIQKIK